MSSPVRRPLLDYFADLDDPRIDRTKDHPLINVVFIAVCAVIAGGEGWTDMETFGQSKRRWLAQFLDVSEGTPSDDTFRRVISRLDPKAFEDRFRRWTAAVVQRSRKGEAGQKDEGEPGTSDPGTLEGEHVALDGKTLRGSFDRDRETLRRAGAAKDPIQLVSAWAKENRLILAQETVEEGTNEISALPGVLGALELSGALVTIDAIGTQKEIAEQITGRGGEYVLALKSNHPRLYGDVKSYFEDAVDRELPGMSVDNEAEVDGGHGRVEVRRCWATDDIEWLDARDQWPGLRSLAMVEAQRSESTWDEEAEKRVWTESVERRYYISSLSADAERVAQAVRSHWGIENKVHWVLDVSFSEDGSRIRKGEGPRNVGLLRRIAMNALRQAPAEESIKGRRKKAGWDEEYLEKVLGIR